MDVVFGTHNIGKLPVLLERARIQEEAQFEIAESLEALPCTLPTRRESAYAAWVSISVGCNNTCTFCIVPALRGKEKDRRTGDILAEIEALVAEGVCEITLLRPERQRVRLRHRRPRGLLQAAAGLREDRGPGAGPLHLPHPRDFADDVIAAMAETPNVMPQLHMPMQSGSDRVLKAMRRSYRQERCPRDDREGARRDAGRRHLHRHHRAGFPGETEEDFDQTMHAVRRGPACANAFTFQCSKRPGTAGRRHGRPGSLGGRAGAVHAPVRPPGADLLGRRTRNRSAAPWTSWSPKGEGRKDGAAHRLSGRAPDNRLVHFTKPGQEVRPGDVVTVEVTYAAPHHLLAEGASSLCAARARATPGRSATAAAAKPAGVMLGLPTIGAPAPLPGRRGSRTRRCGRTRRGEHAAAEAPGRGPGARQVP
ncbi:tRNA-2-methylthio-N(6)-dimethylallyladenosine synthase OS=Streptomyces glaucescens OX=1907 GN=miaB PE=3 SV=1 [Streptomyces glaucescens]